MKPVIGGCGAGGGAGAGRGGEAGGEAEARRILSDATALFFGEPEYFLQDFPESSETAETAGEDAWEAEWRRRVACWWIGLPLPSQQQMGACIGALSLSLGSKLDAAWRSARGGGGGIGGGGGGGGGGGTRAQLSAVEPGCDWVNMESTSLPSVPEMPSQFKWTLPPIPRLIPTLRELQSFNRQHPHLARSAIDQRASREASREASRDASRDVSRDASREGSHHAQASILGMSAAVGIAIGALFALGVTTMGVSTMRRKKATTDPKMNRGGIDLVVMSK